MFISFSCTVDELIYLLSFPSTITVESRKLFVYKYFNHPFYYYFIHTFVFILTNYRTSRYFVNRDSITKMICFCKDIDVLLLDIQLYIENQTRD